MDTKLLEEYSKEISPFGTLTLEQLINSHKHLRSVVMKENKDRQDVIDRGIETSVKLVLNYNYVDIRTFFNMSLREIINKYYEE
jgi:hypothetical protein